ITGSVGGDAKVGDTVTVQIGEHTVTTQVGEGSTWSVNVAGSILAGNASISASVAVSDAAGNTTTADATHAYGVDTVAEASVTVDDVTSDNTVNLSESTGTVSITGSVGGDAKVGDTVTVQIGEHTVTTLVVEGNTWSVDVAGSVLAGNASISASVAAS
ncbi:Ig-like domain-containing protein, partial [Eoetvoesiella caeni]